MQIDVRDLSKRFGAVRANDGISLSFAAGQIHGVLGENGAGKSTLMKLLSGFLRPDGGEILVDGRAVQFASPADGLRAGIGMVHQEPLDVPAFTALENFACGSPRAILPGRAAARDQLVRRAAQLGFSALPDAQVGALTVGQRQQLEILRLLANGARALILDEPTTGITAAQKDALFAALRQLAVDGAVILFVSHKLGEVAELCDTVSVLRAGKVVGAQLAMPQPQERLLGLMFGMQGLGVGRGGDREAGKPVERSRAPSPQPPAPSPQPRTPVWRLDHATLRGGTIELRGLTLDIPPGASIGLAGLEGSGQLLLLRALAGLLRPSAGRLLLHGRDMTGRPVAEFLRAGVEYIPADRLAEGVVAQFSLAEHLALLHGGGGLLLDRRAAERAAAAAIVAYDIRATPSQPLGTLSGGNQQRAMLALLPEHCAGLLLDQPTRGLDVTSAQGVWRRLHERRANGAALVFASADLDEVLEHGEQVLVFFGGRVSPLLPRAELTADRLAELIGGVGFRAMGE
jgi:ABC-type uncharacterized transport system ATPase subunit